MNASIRPRLRLAVGAMLSCMVLLGTTACSEEPEGSTTNTTEELGPIEVVVEGESVLPVGERIEVAVGEPITVKVTSDRTGSLHVHSTPEQEIEFTEGSSEHEIVLDQPGVVEVESHDPDLVVLQLEAR